MRRLTLTVVLFVLALAAVPAASAHNTTWYWSPVAAEGTLLREGLDWDEGFEEVLYADCSGRGRSIWNGAHTRRLYKHFNCYVETDTDPDAYWVRFHVIDKHNWTANFLYYD